MRPSTFASGIRLFSSKVDAVWPSARLGKVSADNARPSAKRFLMSSSLLICLIFRGAHPIECETRDHRRRLLREWVHRADVDLAKDVTVFAGRRARSIEEVGIPDNRQGSKVDPQQAHHLRRPFLFHPRPERLKFRSRRRMHDARTRLGGFRIGAFRRRRDQRLDQLMSEADDLVGTHVTADHTLRQSSLEWLIDDAAVGGEVFLAAAHEVGEQHALGQGAAAGMKNADQHQLVFGTGYELDLPYALAA